MYIEKHFTTVQCTDPTDQKLADGVLTDLAYKTFHLFEDGSISEPPTPLDKLVHLVTKAITGVDSRETPNSEPTEKPDLYPTLKPLFKNLLLNNSETLTEKEAQIIYAQLVKMEADQQDSSVELTQEMQKYIDQVVSMIALNRLTIASPEQFAQEFEQKVMDSDQGGLEVFTPE